LKNGKQRAPILNRRRYLQVLVGSLVFAPFTVLAAAEPFRTSDVTEAGLGIHGFDLKDHHGKPCRLTQFKGKAVLIFFGLTSCPYDCPTLLAKLAMVLRGMGGDASSVQVLFMTLDPQRDTPILLGGYLTAFHPLFLGLRGDELQTRAIAKQFRISYQKIPLGKDNYTLDHSAYGYVFGPDGRLRLFIQPAASTSDIRHDLKKLIHEA